MPNKTEIIFFSGGLYRIIFYNFFSRCRRVSPSRNWFSIFYLCNRQLWGKKRHSWQYSETPSWNDYAPGQECRIWMEERMPNKDFPNGRDWIQKKGSNGNMNISDKVAAEFLAKVFHPRIRSKSHFVHCRESPAKASILLVLSVLNVGWPSGCLKFINNL